MFRPSRMRGNRSFKLLTQDDEGISSGWGSTSLADIRKNWQQKAAEETIAAAGARKIQRAWIRCCAPSSIALHSTFGHLHDADAGFQPVENRRSLYEKW
jgi:hypothetical protein